MRERTGFRRVGVWAPCGGGTDVPGAEARAGAPEEAPSQRETQIKDKEKEVKRGVKGLSRKERNRGGRKGVRQSRKETKRRK